MRSCVQDIPALKYVTRINGLTHINLTKLDVLSDLPVLQVRHQKHGSTLLCVLLLLTASVNLLHSPFSQTGCFKSLSVVHMCTIALLPHELSCSSASQC